MQKNYPNVSSFGELKEYNYSNGVYSKPDEIDQEKRDLEYQESREQEYKNDHPEEYEQES